ncbi:MAG: thioredoxin fold domain-containing protein [Bacteroidota bacterium]
MTLNPKKIFIDFYTDWCTYCRKMDKVVFTKPEVIRLLNEDYHTVKMNAESMDTIRFDSQVFINDQVGKSRRPLHQLAQLLATRDGQFTPPVIIVLNEKFEVIDRYFEYLDSKRLLKALN